MVVLSPAKRTLVLASLLSASAITFGDAPADEDMSWLRPPPEALREASNDVRSVLGVAETSEPEQREASGLRDQIDVLISSSLGDAGIESIARYAAACQKRYPDTVGIRLVFRGIHRGETLGDFVRKQKAIMASLLDSDLKDYTPEVTIDFQLFRDHSPDGLVPVVLYRGEAYEGVANACLPIESDLRNLGGETQVASEVDMRELIRERVDAIDWEKKRREMAGRYYQKRLNWVSLPAAKEPRERDLDMRVRVTSDMRTPDGQLLAKAGDVFDPLNAGGFTQTLLIADLRKAEQEQWLIDKSVELRDAGKPVMVVLAGVPEKTPEYLSKVEQKLKLPVYFLQQNVADRFQLEFTPAEVARSPKLTYAMRVTEYAIKP